MNINERNYGDLSEAVAFMIHSYDDIAPGEFDTILCKRCGHVVNDKAVETFSRSCRNML